MTDVSSLDARRAARTAAANASSRVTTTRRTQARDRALTSTLACLLDTIEVLEAGGVRAAIDGLKVLAELVEGSMSLADCTTLAHAGPVTRHPSGVYVCARCGAML